MSTQDSAIENATETQPGDIHVSAELSRDESPASVAGTVKTGAEARLKVRMSKICTIVIGEKTYKLDFTFSRLADAEEFFSNRGRRECNILFALSPATLNVNRFLPLIACAAHTHHPELSYPEATGLVTPGTLYELLNIYYDVFLPAASEDDIRGTGESNVSAQAAVPAYAAGGTIPAGTLVLVDEQAEEATASIVKAVDAAFTSKGRRSVGRGK